MIRRILLVGLLVGLVAAVMATPVYANGPTEQEVKEAIANGVAWLAEQQNDEPDYAPGDHYYGSWGNWEVCAVTALAVKKLEHHAVDPKWGLGLPSPFDPAYPYKDNVEKGLDYLFDNCAGVMDIEPQPAGDPDTNGNGVGVYFEDPPSAPHHRTYTTGIALMTICEAVELDRVVGGTGPLAGLTYEQVARDTMDYLAFGQNDGGLARGGWGYFENDVGWGSDNSNSGYAALGLIYAGASPPEGCGFTVPQFVKDELDIWIDYVQNDAGAGDNQWCDMSGVEWGDCDGGSGYTGPAHWVNVLKTGNLLQQMAFAGDTTTTPRVTHALGYLERHWNDPNWEPGWKGVGISNYQATYAIMKGMTVFGIHEFGDPPIDWQADFETSLLTEQITDPLDPNYGSWPATDWDFGVPPILSTTWALLTLQKAAPEVPPPSVGGTTSYFVDSGSASGWAHIYTVTLVAITGVLAIGAIGWYARRRWQQGR